MFYNDAKKLVKHFNELKGNNSIAIEPLSRFYSKDERTQYNIQGIVCIVIMNNLTKEFTVYAKINRGTYKSMRYDITNNEW